MRNILRVECTQRREAPPFSGEYLHVEFFIDEQPFLTMLHDFERPFAAELAGEYGPLFYANYTEDFLLGRVPGNEGATEASFDKTTLLACTCGDVGCWPMLVRIKILNKNTVVWNDFEQPHRPHWDYAGFGPFRFKLEAYKAAIVTIPKAPPDWRRRRQTTWEGV